MEYQIRRTTCLFQCGRRWDTGLAGPSVLFFIPYQNILHSFRRSITSCLSDSLQCLCLLKDYIPSSCTALACSKLQPVAVFSQPMITHIPRMSQNIYAWARQPARAVAKGTFQKLNPLQPFLPGRLLLAFASLTCWKCPLPSCSGTDVCDVLKRGLDYKRFPVGGIVKLLGQHARLDDKGDLEILVFGF